MVKRGIYFVIILFIIISIGFILAAATEPKIYYKLGLKYENGKISIKSLDIEFSKDKIENSFGFYSAKVIDYNNKVIDTINFSVPNEALVDYVDPGTGEISGGGMVVLNQTEFEIYVPYNEKAKDIIIYDGYSKELGKNDVSEYSKDKSVVNNMNSVNSKENNSGSIISTSKNVRKSIFDYWWIFLIAIILVLIVIYIVKKNINTKK